MKYLTLTVLVQNVGVKIWRNNGGVNAFHLVVGVRLVGPLEIAASLTLDL